MATEAAVGDIVYVGYVADGVFHQLVARVEHLGEKGVEVRVADNVEWEHGDCFTQHAGLIASTMMPIETPRQELETNRVLRLPLSAVIRKLGESEDPIFVLCTPSLVSHRAQLTRCGRPPIRGSVVRDCFRRREEDRSCVIVEAVSGEKWKYRGTDYSMTLSTSTLSMEERRDPEQLRKRYIDYLRKQVALHFGGMGRHVVSGVKESGIAFTYSNCYLTPSNQLVVDIADIRSIGTVGFLGTALCSVTPAKRDVIYGRPTKKSLDQPHPSGRSTLIWVNTALHAGLDTFIRFCLLTPEQRQAHDPADAVSSMLAPGGAPTVFSQLAQGYYEPTRAQLKKNEAFARMMETVCWDFEISK